MYGYIYITENLINNRRYIGQRKGKFDPNYLGSGKNIKKEIKELDRNIFVREIIEFISPEENPLPYERKWIKFFGSLTPMDII